MNIIPILALVLITTACSPIYHWNSRYIQPESIAATQCTTQCGTNKLLCTQSEQLDYNNCLNLQTQDKIDAEKNQGAWPPINVRSCSQNSTGHCVNQYDQCFTNCGGQIIVEKECLAFCENNIST